MVFNESLWINSFKTFAKRNNATFIIKKYPSVGYSADYITCYIKSIFKSGFINISQTGLRGNNEVGLNHLVLDFDYKNDNFYSLILYRRDFFDRFFTKHYLKTGNEKFDKEFIIKTSDQNLTIKLFTNQRVQEIFLKNQCLLLNVQSKNGVTSIKFKSMEQKIYTQEELQGLYDIFLLMINTLI